MRDYIHTVEAAKMLRKRLRDEFPGIKFSVRCESYSMGSHMNVCWTDGPTSRQVSEIAAPYSGTRFDGMIDMSYHCDSWLLPDGRVVYAGSNGTEGSRGSVPKSWTEKPHPDAKMVSFLGSTPSCTRTISPDFEAACGRAWEALDGQTRCDLLSFRLQRWPEDNPALQLAYSCAADKRGLPKIPLATPQGA